MPAVLTSILGSIAKSFRREHWGRSFVRTRVRPATIRLFENELLGFDVPALIRRSADTAVWLQTLDGFYRDVRGVSAKDALAFYEAGHTLYLHGAPTPALRAWHERLSGELGHPRDRLLFSLFAARASAATRCHFDSIENFTIQLRGRKRWWLAPNRHVEAPTESWVTRDVIPPRFRLQVPRGLPDEMPAGAHAVELRAGDLLYIPRGWWHATDTSEDSLSAFVGFPATTWAELVMGALGSQLQRDPAWRGNVIASWESPGHRERARRELAARLQSLAKIVADLHIDEIAPELRARKGRAKDELRRNPIATLELVRVDKRTMAGVVCVQRRVLVADRKILVQARLAPALHELQRLDGKLSREDFVRRFARLGEAEVASLLGSLADFGYLL